MPKLSARQIKELSSTGFLFSRLHLVCDGFDIKLVEHRYVNGIRTAVYVNGGIKGIWLSEDSDWPERKFYPFMKIRVKKNILKPDCRKTETKVLKRRDVDFASIGQALRHLNSVCDSVELIEENDCES